MDPELTHDLERAEANALRNGYAALPPEAAGPLGTHVATIGGATALALTLADFGIFNRVVGLGVFQPVTEDDVEAVSRFYLDLGQTQSAVQLPPAAEAPPLTDWLAARGYEPRTNWVKTWHDLDAIPEASTSLRIERIGAAHAAAFGSVVCAAYEMPAMLAPLIEPMVGMPGWSHYMGFDGDDAVSVGAMYVEDGLAWLGWGATLETHRGLGGQSAIFIARLRAARALGCRIAVSETGEEDEREPVNHSYRNMIRLGFRLAYPRRNWARMPKASS